MTFPHVVVLAGGQGKRLGGVRKADLQFRGERMLERVLAQLGTTTEPVLVAVGPHKLEMPLRAHAVSDLPVGPRGPLAGILSAAAFLRSQGIIDGLLVSVTVDTPFLPEDYIPRLINGLSQAAAAYASWNGHFYPPNAVWRLEALKRDPESLVSAKALLNDLHAVAVDWGDTHATDPFRNINTPADLLTLSQGPEP